MAPIVSLAARNLPPTFDAVDLRGFVHESFDYDVHVWPLVNEYADDGSTVLSRSATIAVDIPTPKLGTRENGVNEMIEILNGRKIICRGGEWFSTFDKQFYGIVPLYEHQQGSDVECALSLLYMIPTAYSPFSLVFSRSTVLVDMPSALGAAIVKINQSLPGIGQGTSFRKH